jgi:hypothetical protein
VAQSRGSGGQGTSGPLAMIQEGDNFDFNRWLKKVREEEAQAKQAEATGILGGLALAQIAVPIKPFQNPPQPLTAKTTLARALRHTHCQAKSKTPKARLRRWLERVCGEWEDFQTSRRRDAVYGYLEAVLAIVAHYRVRRRTNRLLRHAFQFANLQLDKNADPFTAVFRCTCGAADSKTISKWARALRYVSRCKQPRIGLKAFMKEASGVNACADRYAKRLGRGHRR